MSTVDTSALIERVALNKAKTSFVESYQKSTPLDSLKEEGLGIAISVWADWSGTKIMRVFMSALEDANFHDEAAQVAEMLEKY